MQKFILHIPTIKEQLYKAWELHKIKIHVGHIHAVVTLHSNNDMELQYVLHVGYSVNGKSHLLHLPFRHDLATVQCQCKSWVPQIVVAAQHIGCIMCAKQKMHISTTEQLVMWMTYQDAVEQNNDDEDVVSRSQTKMLKSMLEWEHKLILDEVDACLRPYTSKQTFMF